MVGRLKYLVDTNVWLDLMLERERAPEVKRFLGSVDATDLALSESTLDSIGMILFRRGRGEAFTKFVRDTLPAGGVHRLALDYGGLAELHRMAQQFKLDFDDAYQVAVAQRHGLTIVSYDADLDRSPLGRATPDEVLSRPR